MTRSTNLYGVCSPICSTNDMSGWELKVSSFAQIGGLITINKLKFGNILRLFFQRLALFSS